MAGARTILSLLLMAGWAAAAIAGPARLAPGGEPVAACPWFGPGFFRIPASDSCISLSADILAETRLDFARKDLYIETVRLLGEPIAFYDRRSVDHSVDRTQFRTDARLNLLTATAVDGHPLVTSIVLRSAHDVTAASRSGGSSGSGLFLDQGWIRYRWLTAGRHASFFDFMSGYSMTGGYASQRNVNLAALTVRPTERTSLTVSVEDQTDRRYQDGVWASYAGQSRPDIILQGRWMPAFGIVHAAIASHLIRDGLTSGSREGFAANAGFEYRQKWSDLFGSAAGDSHGRILATATLTQGALDYLGVPRFATDYGAAANGQIIATRGRSLVLSYEHVWNASFKTTVTFSGYALHTPFSQYDHKVSGTVLQAGVEYMPVPGLMVGAEANYYRDRVKGRYFGVQAPSDRVGIVTANVYLRRRF